MFCRKCGRPTVGEKIICDECAAKMAAKTQPQAPVQAPVEAPVAAPAKTAMEELVETPIEVLLQATEDVLAEETAEAAEQTPVEIPAETIEETPDEALKEAEAEQDVVTPEPAQEQQEPGFIVNTDFEEPPVQKKKFPMWIILAAGAVLLAAALVVAGIFLWPKLFNEPEETVATEETQPKIDTSVMVQTAGAAYGSFLEGLNSAAAATTPDYTVAVTAGEDLVALIKDALIKQELNIDFSGLTNVSLDMKVGGKDSNYGADLLVDMNGTDILTVNIYADVAQKVFYVGCPELSDTYVSMPMKFDPTVFTTAANMPRQLAQQLAKDLPDQAAFEVMLDKYLKALTDQLKAGEKTQVTIAINNISRELTANTRKITEKEVATMLAAVLKITEEDPTAQQMVTAVVNYVNGLGAYMAQMQGTEYTPVDTQKLTEAITSYVSDVESSEGAGKTITLVTYTDEAGNICGYTLTDTEGQMLIDFKQVVDGEKSAFEMNLPMDVYVRGQSGKDGEVNTSSVELIVDHEKMFTVHVQEAADGKQICLTPGNALMEVLAGNNPSLAMVGFAKPELILTVKENAVNAELVLSGKTFVTVNMAADPTATFAPQKPEKTVSNQDKEALAAWIAALDYNRLLQLLKDINMPQKATDFKKAMIAWLTEQLTPEEPKVPETTTPDATTPGTQTPGTQTPGTQTPGTQTPGTQTPGTQTPGTQTPGTQTPGTQTPGTQTPGTQNPGTQNPGTQTPGTAAA